ncbi:hypothetical protein ACGF5M_00845 [Gemmatimonadota bacterium]
MKTTTVLIELVLVGAQVLIWLLLLLFTLFGYEWIDLAILQEWRLEFGVGVLGLAYVVGTVFDRVIGTIHFDWAISASTAKSLKSWLPSVVEMRMHLANANKDLYEVVETRMNQMIMVRGAAFNGALIAVTGLAFLITRIGISAGQIILLSVLALAMVSIAGRTWYRTTALLSTELLIAHNLVSGNSGLTPSTSTENATD